ncbi:MAG: hypothetical protein COZ16_01480 [Flavobacteriaceae bacterium CG_4_10_14_3_um_filter_31_253]|nr:MAG: hypothetical protein COW43_07705 [Flavobacteriaceae bacterium CG17_big_fil_post_rev_8_21_14_2_50_31_13]PIX12412.1 MAG: hypothetical protein COZ74_11295 [Flavobacteriaceae bacterium CG_4_8_14_3_um_filter_31_8]PIY16041.1 MAG: hypothetical protein COZ16_01480 [Flavobacteriaceae bacterium CG_4_10_14_3_um_filter_31_253]PIZ09890.1 MAG: hypothetical protein COY55_10655 [Flavobacteriaceae bacterium CG_4_10_14_0_8_um_filter_31_99]PJC09336.1 MAG: hypothetical protein CO067_10170 [Flavobacteriacea
MVEKRFSKFQKSKKMKKQIITIALLINSLIGYSNAEINNYLVDNSKKVTVEFRNVKKGHLLSIKDNKGVTIYSEVISENGHLAKILDVTYLEQGTYYVELDKDFEIVIKPFKIKENIVIFEENEEKTIFKPVIRNQENMIFISKIALDNEPMQVVIYYNDEVIFSETIQTETILNRIYRLEKEIKGNYKVVFYNNNRSFENAFKI